MSHGGKREGSGRKAGGRTVAQKKAIDMAAKVLQEVDQVRIWKKLLKSHSEKIVLGAIQYLTDRAHGRAPQRQVLQGDPENPVRHAATLTVITAGGDDDDNED